MLCPAVLFPEDLPRDCVADCSAMGKVDDAVEHWRRSLDFTVDRDRAVHFLRETGGWDEAELAATDDDTLARRVLWLACCSLAESGSFSLED